MNNEIKEILRDDELLKKIENILAGELTEEEYDNFYDYFNEIRNPNIIVDIKDDENIKDYITNLQNENIKYDQCLTELTDNYKDLQKELTNLQEELEGKNKEIKDLKNRLYTITTKFN